MSFGPDCLYGDHVALHGVFSNNLSTAFTKAANYERVEYVEGFENTTEASHNILRWLVKHNYSDEDIAKVLGGNSIRALKEIWI